MVLGLLKPYPAEGMAAYPVSRLVNSPHNDGPELIIPVDTGPAQPSLIQ
jgi:putative SOS response-associated peptidase YedK